LRLKYKIENSTREDILELPERMLHEGVVNAVCHRDLFEVGSRVMMEIFDDRVDIVSPGGVPKGITTDNFGTVSITRNSVIAAMLHRINYIEQMGTGIERMRNAAQEADVAEPEFELNNFFKVTFRRSTLDTSSDTQATASDHKRPQATVSDINRHPSDTQATLSDRKSTIISYLEEQDKASSPDLARHMGVTPNWVRTILRQMAVDGTIEKIGDNRSAYYVLKRKS